jgi:hypothetical protein
MLEYIEDGRMYRTTKRGMNFLESYDELRRMLTPKHFKPKVNKEHRNLDSDARPNRAIG